MKHLLTIAGSDSCGGAGIQADLKTFSAHGTFGMSVITAITAQNTQGVFDVEDMSPKIIETQIDAIFKDIRVDAVKIGMVSKIDTIQSISKKLDEYKPEFVVVDPVMISKSGYSLLKPESKEALIKELIPKGHIITPNIPEAEEILKREIKNVDDMKKAAKDLYELGPKNVLVKGGHLDGEAIDILFDGQDITILRDKRINTKNTHGTGCTLSSAIASNLALGYDTKESVKHAKEYITEAIKYSFSIGKGVGPTNHFYKLYKDAGLNYE